MAWIRIYKQSIGVKFTLNITVASVILIFCSLQGAVRLVCSPLVCCSPTAKISNNDLFYRATVWVNAVRTV